MTQRNDLSAVAQELLRRADMFGEPIDGDPGRVQVRDVDEGLPQFVVPASIDTRTLVAIIEYGKRQFELGRGLGRVDLQHQLCSLIGAQMRPTQES